MDVTQRLLDEVLPRLEDPTVPEVPKYDATRILRGVSSEIDAVVADGGYEDAVLTYLDDQVRRFNADPENLDDGEAPRSDPLCTCSDRFCDLKEGELPVDIREADSLSAGIRDFKQTHRGKPLVLDEAHETYREDVALVRQAIGDMILLLSNEVGAREAGITPDEYGLDDGTFAPAPDTDGDTDTTEATV